MFEFSKSRYTIFGKWLLKTWEWNAIINILIRAFLNIGRVEPRGGYHYQISETATTRLLPLPWQAVTATMPTFSKS